VRALIELHPSVIDFSRLAWSISMSPSLVSAIDWRERDGLYTCNLLLHDHGYTHIPLKAGSELSFKVQPGRRCVGYHKLTENGWRKLTTCPTSSLSYGYSQCPSCQARDSAAPCLRCRGDNCTALELVRDACMGSRAFVYLAAFNAKLKVGVTREDRFVTRWVEQGADAAMRILTGNGSEVRKLEHIISTQLGVHESVRGEAKASALGGVDKTKLALALFETTREKAHIFATKEQRITENPWILARYYNIPPMNQRPIRLKVEDNITVAGEIVGVKGPTMLLRSGSVYYVMGLSALLGRLVEFTPGGVMSQSGLEPFLSRST
jgi:Protein of unknown function (DUF2797)